MYLYSFCVDSIAFFFKEMKTTSIFFYNNGKYCNFCYAKKNMNVRPNKYVLCYLNYMHRYDVNRETSNFAYPPWLHDLLVIT